MGSRLERSQDAEIIRSARVDDTDFLCSLSEKVFRPYARNPTALMLRMMRKRTSEIWVAEAGGERLGFVVTDIAELGREYGPWTRPAVAHLDAIAVRPSLQRTGIGRRLLAHAETTARERGAVSMSLLTAEKNVRARRLFWSNGYRLLTALDDVYAGRQPGHAMFKTL